MWLYKEKPVNALLSIADGKTYQYKVAREIGINTSYAVTLVKKFSDCGLVTRTKEGRTNIVNITDKGKMIAEKIRLVKQEV